MSELNAFLQTIRAIDEDATNDQQGNDATQHNMETMTIWNSDIDYDDCLAIHSPMENMVCGGDHKNSVAAGGAENMSDEHIEEQKVYDNEPSNDSKLSNTDQQQQNKATGHSEANSETMNSYGNNRESGVSSLVAVLAAARKAVAEVLPVQPAILSEHKDTGTPKLAVKDIKRLMDPNLISHAVCCPISTQPQFALSDETTDSEDETDSSKKSRYEDDDCVIIEDNLPYAKQLENSVPPVKNQLSKSLPAAIKNQPTITQFLVPKADRSTQTNFDAGSYSHNTILAPKAANNVSLAETNVANVSLTGTTSLPTGLTDDMYVLEVPSFVVPFIYEKQPASKLKDIIKEIEIQHKLNEEDLMTEQNKECKEEVLAKEKRKCQAVDKGQETCSQHTNRVGAMDLSQANTGQPNGHESIKPDNSNYFESPLGEFFMSIGRGLVEEYVQQDLQQSSSEASQTKYNFCNFCDFRSDSSLVLANHYETPHRKGVYYVCNYCPFKTRKEAEVIYHMELEHSIKARRIIPISNQCPNCGFETRNKSSLARHKTECAKRFKLEQNLESSLNWDPPAKLPHIQPRHGLVSTAAAYQALYAQAAAPNWVPSQQQQNSPAKKRRQSPIVSQANDVLRRVQPLRSPRPKLNQMEAPSTQLPPKRTYATAKRKLPAQESSTTTHQSAAASTSGAMKPIQHPADDSETTPITCEICDGYMQNFEGLWRHMSWTHEVEIQASSKYKRPPLDCLKCKRRFFTDQGLERHILGAHGLVTHALQEAAAKGEDGGRCPICGSMHQSNLLDHVLREHQITVKFANLTYKCVACTAIFHTYKEFEQHVNSAHAVLVKENMFSKKDSQGKKN